MQERAPETQFEWHEAHRDLSKNMYRTTYVDMIHGKEVFVKSDYPSGYGGHIPSIRHDILHRNTAFDRQTLLKRNDPNRDSHPSFVDQLAGVPTWCLRPQGARNNPNRGVRHAHTDWTTQPKPPWAIVQSMRPPPNYRSTPATLMRARSQPALVRSNPAAQGAAAAALGASSSSPQLVPASPTGPLQRTVSMANAQANQMDMPSAQAVLMEEMGGEGGYF